MRPSEPLAFPPLQGEVNLVSFPTGIQVSTFLAYSQIITIQ